MPETLYVAVSIVDRMLNKVKILKSDLSKMSLAAILVASKYEEIYPPDLKDLLNVLENKFTKREVLDMEAMILSKLEFDLFAPSSYRFLQRFKRISTVACDHQIFYFA